MTRALLLLPFLAACAAAPEPQTAPQSTRPTDVTLYRDTVTVRMADGAFCTGPRDSGTDGPWRTRLGGCPHPWPVQVLRLADVPRLPLAPTRDLPWLRLTPPQGPALSYGPERP